MNLKKKDNNNNQECLERCARDIQRETEVLHARLRDIAQAVINDDQAFGGVGCCVEEKIIITNGGGSVSPRSRSPVKRQQQFGCRDGNGGGSSSRPPSRCGSPFADATFSAVQAALNKRQLQIHDMKAKLDNSREVNQALKRQIDDIECDKRKFEQAANDMRLQLENTRRSADETSRERDHSKQQLETTAYEKCNLEKVRMVREEISYIYELYVGLSFD
jgi:hypothetical protein